MFVSKKVILTQKENLQTTMRYKVQTWNIYLIDSIFSITSVRDDTFPPTITPPCISWISHSKGGARLVVRIGRSDCWAASMPHPQLISLSHSVCRNPFLQLTQCKTRTQKSEQNSKLQPPTKDKLAYSSLYHAKT